MSQNPSQPSRNPAPADAVLVESRDGSLASLDVERLRADLLDVFQRAGQDDAVLCFEIADIVRAAAKSRMARRYAQGEVRPYLAHGQLGDLIEEAIVQLGHGQLAKAYILARDQRRRSRAALHWVDGSAPAPGPNTGHQPIVRDGSGSTEWDVRRIASALVREAELPEEIAQEVARRVEARVFDGGLRRLTSSLVRAFVDNELGMMGLDDALERQRPVGIPRHDLRQQVSRGDRAPADLDVPARQDLNAALGGEVLRRFALDDVLEPALADLHQRGDLHVEGLAAPHRPLTLALPAELLMEGEPGKRTPAQVLARLAEWLPRTVHGVVLEDIEPAFAAVGRGSRAAEAAMDFVTAAGALSAATGRDLHLARPGGRGGRWSANLLSALIQTHRDGLPIPRLWLDGTELEAALDRNAAIEAGVEDLLASGGLAMVWHGSGDRYAGPGLRRKGRERGPLACASAVHLNLPRLAREAGPWREERFLESIAERVRQSVEILGHMARFQSQREPFGGLAKPRSAMAVTPIGLTEALRILGDGEIRADQGARILGLIAEAAVRFGRDENLSVHLDSAFGAGAAVRFATLDRDQTAEHQARLFTDMPTPESDELPEYTQGFGSGLVTQGRGDAAARREAAAAYLARLLVGVRAGSLRLGVQATPESALLRPAGGHGVLQSGHLDLWRRFEAARSQHLESGPGGAAKPAKPAKTSSRPAKPEAAPALTSAPGKSGSPATPPQAPHTDSNNPTLPLFE